MNKMFRTKFKQELCIGRSASVQVKDATPYLKQPMWNVFSLNQRSLKKQSLKGLTLLEVVLAMAILGTSMVVLGQLINLGHSSAKEARDLTVAQILCDAKISEVSSGVLPLSSVQDSDVLEAPGWKYSLTIDSAVIDGLLSVECIVSQDSAQYAFPTSYRLVRWIPDPDYEAELKELDELEATE